MTPLRHVMWNLSCLRVNSAKLQFGQIEPLNKGVDNANRAVARRQATLSDRQVPARFQCPSPRATHCRGREDALAEIGQFPDSSREFQRILSGRRQGQGESRIIRVAIIWIRSLKM